MLPPRRPRGGRLYQPDLYLDKFDILPMFMMNPILATTWVNESGAYDTKSMGKLANYIDYEAFGRDIQLDEAAIFSDAG